MHGMFLPRPARTVANRRWAGPRLGRWLRRLRIAEFSGIRPGRWLGYDPALREGTPERGGAPRSGVCARECRGGTHRGPVFRPRRRNRWAYCVVWPLCAFESHVSSLRECRELPHRGFVTHHGVLAELHGVVRWPGNPVECPGRSARGRSGTPVSTRSWSRPARTADEYSGSGCWPDSASTVRRQPVRPSRGARAASSSPRRGVEEEIERFARQGTRSPRSSADSHPRTRRGFACSQPAASGIQEPPAHTAPLPGSRRRRASLSNRVCGLGSLSESGQSRSRSPSAFNPAE